jgi:hypothetical protein
MWAPLLRHGSGEAEILRGANRVMRWGDTCVRCLSRLSTQEGNSFGELKDSRHSKGCLEFSGRKEYPRRVITSGNKLKGIELCFRATRSAKRLNCTKVGGGLGDALAPVGVIPMVLLARIASNHAAFTNLICQQ